MSTDIIVVERRSDWKLDSPQGVVITAREYVTQSELFKSRNIRIINLCRSYEYLSTGYYCSLLAEARKHRVIPSVKSISDLSRKALYSLEIEDLDAVVQKVFGRRLMDAEQSFESDIFFGECANADLRDLGRQIFELFPCPILRVEFRRQSRWEIASIKPGSPHRISEEHRACFSRALHAYVAKRWVGPKVRDIYKYDLAILHNPNEKFPPSNKKALQHFVRAGKSLGVDVELVERKDYGRLAEFDALFIRETTNIDDHTYRFSKKAESDGMVVIDDPDSILRCTNKVFLAELLKIHKVPTPNSVILHHGSRLNLESKLPYPIILKIPDGSFSRGTYKANNAGEVEEITKRLFKESDLLLAQEFVRTEFDWRVGVLDRTPIFACQYFMSRKHWQVVRHSDSGRAVWGESKTFFIEDTPKEVVDVALRAANLIGDGLYGVDLKQNQDGVYVIEINDNPNIDAGVEDLGLKDGLYRLVLQEFVRRLDRRRSLGSAAEARVDPNADTQERQRSREGRGLRFRSEPQ
jgi:glutathione synthase/RimK-type ligase-like ATP-grasp enzyme